MKCSTCDSAAGRRELVDEIIRLKHDKNAVILAHYYVDGAIQDIADHVGD